MVTKLVRRVSELDNLQGVGRAEVARLAMDLSKDCACVSHASDMLWVCVMALLHTETEYWREGIVPSLI
jgi:hypothetical protein